MGKKTKKKYVKSGLTIIGILSLALIVFSSYAIIYTYIYENPFVYLGIGLGVSLLLVVFGATSPKKIKNKIKDVFT
jgi:hypothetical protein